jgi:predicted nuclease of predicted toxin-antitoxin system
MARTIRFHLDENCGRRIAAGLRLYGIDLTTAAEVGLLHSSDEEQLGYAAMEGRVLVTRDADFLRLDAAGFKHAGIVYCRPDGVSLGELVRWVMLIWELMEPDEMRGHVEYR